MNKATYTADFKAIIKSAKVKNLFLGTGNPSAKILFIGKEAAIDEVKHPEQHQRELVNNISDWENNLAQEIQFSAVDDWFVSPKYNPLYPYKGQHNCVESRNRQGTIIRGKGGTSKTWHNYQKVVDVIQNKTSQSPNINFHEHAFITELNQVTGSYSNQIPKVLRKQSIAQRTELFKQPFFRQFPVTIVAAGHYIREFAIDLEKMFEVKYDPEKSALYTHGLKNEFINIHFDSIDSPTRLLIHTNQLSMVSNGLTTKIGDICCLFLNGNRPNSVD